MEQGKSLIMPTIGFSQIILSYTSDEEAKKSMFKRKTKDKVISAGVGTETYYCISCKKIIPVYNEE